jgi:ribose 5-phosphate isomerase B
MKIAIGSDHRGIDLKTKVINILIASGHTCKDFGTGTSEPVDYPDIAKLIGEAVAKGEYERGILICDTGIGMSIAANKIKGIRAALCYDAFCAYRARVHNDANILVLGSGRNNAELKEILNNFLTTSFEGGRHQRRLDKIRTLEN